MNITVVHNRVADGDAPDSRDVLQQAEAVTAALTGLGHDVALASCTLDLESMKKLLVRDRPHLVFNLVEDLDGHGRLIHLFPFLLDALGIAYSGSSAESILLTSHKIRAKERMVSVGLPTPAWAGPYPPGGAVPEQEGKPRRWIIKSLWEHASIGLDGGSVVEPSSMADLEEIMRERCAALGGACFAEEFIDGREFNLSLLAAPGGPEVLPPAEIIFEGFGPDMTRIVDYQAKWDENSSSYHRTPRRFDFPDEDEELIRNLKDIARRCWEEFGLAGYARVDFRVDGAGRPSILEINANPCLSPDAGFAAALERAGIDFQQAVARIVSDAAPKHQPKET